MDLDKILKNRPLRLSVSKIISELFYENRFTQSQYGNGEILHYKLGFLGAEKYCKFIQLDFLGLSGKYVEICGSPDRIQCKESDCYVDELKTTYSNKESFIYKVGYAQVQLYMLITGINKGRLYIYFKDKNELKEYKIEYDDNFVKDLLKRYLTILSYKRNE